MPEERTRTTTCLFCSTSLTVVQISRQNRHCSSRCGNSARVKPPTERFWRFVPELGNGCQQWTGQILANGYGAMRSGGKGLPLIYAHRLSWQVQRGPIPEGLWVLHHCDNPPCVRIDHLFLGTPKDNTLDMLSKGRGPTGDRNGSKRHPESIPRGSQKTMARLTENDVLAIRASHAAGILQREIAAEYGVAPSLISGILSKKRWRHVV